MAVYDGSRHSLPGRRTAFIVLCLLYSLVAGLRFRTGVDTVTYEFLYRCLNPKYLTLESFLSVECEPGFKVLAVIFGLVSRSPWPLFLTLALWINISVFLFAWRQRETVGQRIFLFIALYLLLAYIPMNFEIIRQSAAVACLLWAFPSLRSRRYLSYYLWIAGAIFFHMSAVVLMALPLLDTEGARRCLSSMKFLLPVSLLLLAASWLFDKYALMWMSEQAWLPDAVRVKSRDYILLYQRTGALNLNGMLGMIVKTAVYPGAALWLTRRYSSGSNSVIGDSLRHDLFGLERAMVSVGLLVVFSGVCFRPLMRFVYYFLPFFIAVMSLGVSELRRRYSAWLVTAAFLPLILLTLYGYCGRHEWFDGKLHSSYEVYWPYRNVITGEKDYVRDRAMLKISGMDCELSQKMISAGPEGYEDTADDHK